MVDLDLAAPRPLGAATRSLIEAILDKFGPDVDPTSGVVEFAERWLYDNVYGSYDVNIYKRDGRVVVVIDPKGPCPLPGYRWTD